MAEAIRRVRPTPFDGYLGNPHKGCCTFQHFNGDPLFPGITWSEEGPTAFPPAERPVAEGYLPTTVAYCRWFWKLMETRRGAYDFSMIDGALKTCQERGQTLAVRLMAHGSARQPQVPDWYPGPKAMNRHKKIEFMAPVYDSPEYFELWSGLVREFAPRYDGHELLESIDVTYIGPWGEGAGDATDATCLRFAELWRELFPRTPRLALVALQQLRAGMATGAGWRCDCFGDLKTPGSPDVPRHLSNNHTFDAYPRCVCQSGAQEAWRTGPVHFETCGVPGYWFQNGYDLDFIIQQGLKMHGTYFMPKSTALPEPWREKLAAFCRRLGYRFVLRQATCSAWTTPGGRFHFTAWIENVGVAPIYRRYEFVLRLRQGERTAILRLPAEDIRRWLPGDVWLEETFDLPEGFERGWVELSAGLVDAADQVKVRFAVKEQFSDGWVPLEGLEVR